MDNVKVIVRRAAEEAGFDLAGIAPASDAPELKHFPEWIAAGHAGKMKYLAAVDEQGDLKRASLARGAPWAKRVVVCAINYNTDQPYSTQVPAPKRGWTSGSARSSEAYREAAPPPLKQVEAALHQAIPADFHP